MVGPPSPWLVESWSYMFFRLQNIEYTGLIRKIFRNKVLEARNRHRIRLLAQGKCCLPGYYFKELVLGRLRRPSLETDAALRCPKQRILSHWSGWVSVTAVTEDCAEKDPGRDGGRWRRSQHPTLENHATWGTRRRDLEYRLWNTH